MRTADVKCLAFSPPGGLMSKNLSRAVEPFVTSVVVGKDVVPRLSVVNIGRLIDQMVSPAQKTLNPKPWLPFSLHQGVPRLSVVNIGRLIDQMVRPVTAHKPQTLNPSFHF